MLFKSVRCELDDGYVGHLALSRPDKANAMNEELWTELPQALAWLDQAGARSIVLSGDGRSFCAGIDLSALGDHAAGAAADGCQARQRLAFISFATMLQEAMTACERCRCPVLAAVHGACYGAGVDLATACDVRYSTEDARFCVKEVDIAIPADMGTLARLPGIVGDGVARELALTARVVSGAEALRLGLVTAAFPDREALMRGAAGAARAIAAKSPVAVAGTKAVLLRQRGRTVAEGLEHVAQLNASILPGSHDVREVFAARAEGRAPRFSKL